MLKSLPVAAVGNTRWTAVSDPETGVALDLPPGWRTGVPKTFDASTMSSFGDSPGESAAMQQMTADFDKRDAEAEKKQLATMREKEGIVLHCVDGSKPTIGEEPTRLFVKRIPDCGYSTLEDATAAEKSDAHRAMEATVVHLPVGDAARLVAKGRNRIGDEECHVSYVFLNGADAYVLRFASTNNPEAILGIEKNVATTFRIVKK